jgi:hypothetical protein
MERQNNLRHENGDVCLAWNPQWKAQIMKQLQPILGTQERQLRAGSTDKLEMSQDFSDEISLFFLRIATFLKNRFY